MDLGRAELEDLSDRYVRPSVLLVAPEEGSLSRLEEAFEAEGWDVSVCRGPGKTRCPILEEGRSCRLVATADVKIVRMRRRSPQGHLATIRCAADHSSPTLLALEGRIGPPREESGYTVVGDLEDPRTIVAAARRLRKR